MSLSPNRLDNQADNPTEHQPGRSPTGHWSNLALLRLGAFGFGMTGFFVAMDAIVLPILVLDVAPEGAKNTWLGILAFSGLLVAALVQPIVGSYSDRTRSPLGRRVPYMLCGIFFVCLGLTGLSFTLTLISLLIIWIFIQTNASIGYGPYQALIRDLVPLNRIGVASALKVLADAGGGLALVALSGFLISRYTGPESIIWLRITLGALGGTLLLTMAISATTVVTRERASGLLRHGSRSLTRATAGLHSQLPWFLLSRFMLIAASVIFSTYGLFFLQDVVKVNNPAQTLSTAALAVGGAVALTVYPAGWLSDRIGRKPVILTGAIGAAIGSVAVFWAGNAAEAIAMATVIGAFLGLVLSASWAMANEMATPGREGQHIAIVNLATIAGAACAKTMGPVVDLFNSLVAPGSGYAALLFTCAILFVLGGLLLLPLKSLPEPQPEAEGPGPHPNPLLEKEGP